MSFFSQAFDPIRRFERQYAQFVLAHSQTIPWPGTAQVNLGREFISVRGLDAALAGNPRIILTGRPGAGKTTTLAHFAAMSARALLEDEHEASVPIFFTAREFSKENLPHVSQLPNGLHMSESLAAQCPKGFFIKALETRRALILIDDLDTLPAAAAQAWLNEFASARVIATGQFPAAELTNFSLPGFRDNDMERALRQWDGGNPEAFFAQLKASRVPRALTANPMTFAMLVRVWQALHSAAHNGNEHPLPNRRTPLFDTYARQILDDSAEKLKMLEDGALAVQRGKLGPDGSRIASSRGFLVDGINSAPEFVHPLWQAFFAARALRHAPDHAPVLDILADPGWQEVVLFYAGMGEANDLVEALVAKGEFTFAGRVLAHSDQVRDDLRSSVSQELIRRAWEDDSEATRVLSEMGSEPAVDTLGARLKEKDPAVRARAARLLGELQLDRGIEYLLPQLRDVDGDVRDRVLEALGKARTDRVVEPLLVALRGDPRVGKVDTRLRIAAAKALGDVGSDRAVTALIVDLQLGEPEVRAVAAESLKRITSPLMLKPLVGILESGDGDARQYATDILAVVNGKRSWTH